MQLVVEVETAETLSRLLAKIEPSGLRRGLSSVSPNAVYNRINERARKAGGLIVVNEHAMETPRRGP